MLKSYKGIILNAVGSASKKLCSYKQDVKGKEKLERNIMLWKEKSAKSDLAKQRHKLTLEWRENITALRELRVNRTFKNIAKEEKSRQRRELKTKRIEKIQFLCKKVEQRNKK